MMQQNNVNVIYSIIVKLNELFNNPLKYWLVVMDLMFKNMTVIGITPPHAQSIYKTQGYFLTSIKPCLYKTLLLICYYIKQ